MPESKGRASRGKRSHPSEIDADFWRLLHREFQDLAQEEYTAVPDPASDRRLRAYGEQERVGRRARRRWRLTEGLNENFLRRFEDAAMRGGVALGPPRGVEPLAFWLDGVFLYLLNSPRNDRGPLVVGREDQGGIIRDICETSATHCLQLAKQSPQTHRMESKRIPTRRYEHSVAIDTALQEIAQMRPKSHAEVFASLEGRAPLSRAEPFRTAKGWMTGFRRDPPRARSWLVKAWTRLGLPAFPRGPK